VLKLLLLDASLKSLFVAGYLSWTGLRRRGSTILLSLSLALSLALRWVAGSTALWWVSLLLLLLSLSLKEGVVSMVTSICTCAAIFLDEHIRSRSPAGAGTVAVLLRTAAVVRHMPGSGRVPEGQVCCTLGCTVAGLVIGCMEQVGHMETAGREVVAVGRATRCRRDSVVVENLGMEDCCPDMAGTGDSRETCWTVNDVHEKYSTSKICSRQLWREVFVSPWFAAASRCGSV
jgi:hypothetical protein